MMCVVCLLSGVSMCACCWIIYSIERVVVDTRDMMMVIKKMVVKMAKMAKKMCKMVAQNVMRNCCCCCYCSCSEEEEDGE